MGKFWRVMALYNAESTTYTACAGTIATSPYNPDFNGRLIGLRVLPGGDAATTLTELVQFRLTCTAWNPNAIEAVGIGNGLRTAPATAQKETDHTVDQPIKSGVGITIEARNVTADTPVGVSVILMGLFVI